MKTYLEKHPARVLRARALADRVERESKEQSFLEYLGLTNDQKKALLKVTDLHNGNIEHIEFPTAEEEVLALAMEESDERESRAQCEQVVNKQRSAMTEIHLLLERQLEMEKEAQEQRKLKLADEQRLLSIRGVPEENSFEFEDDEDDEFDQESFQAANDAAGPLQRNSSVVGTESEKETQSRASRKMSLVNMDPKELAKVMKNKRNSIIMTRRFSIQQAAGQAFCQEIGYIFGPTSVRRDSRPEVSMTAKEKYANYAPHPLLPKFLEKDSKTA